MFSRVRTFLKNHWRKIVISGAVVQIATYGIRYAANRFIEYQTAQAQDMWKRLEKRRHYENMERTCISSYIALIPSLKETLVQSLNTEVLTESLKNKVPNKLEVWEKLKIISFTRVLVTIYGTSLLNVLLRIQLSVIGGYLFQETGAEQRRPIMRNVDGVILSHVTALDTDLQHKYLSLANYFVQGGLKELCEHVLVKAEALLQRVSLKQKVTITNLEELFWSISTAVKGESEIGGTATLNTIDGKYRNPIKYPWRYIFSKEVLESQNYFRCVTQKCRPHYEPPDMYQRLMCETFDLLEADDVSGILQSFESHGISHFLDRIAESISDSLSESSTRNTSIVGSSADASSLEDSFPPNQVYSLIRETAIPIAKLIPIMNGLSLATLDGADPWIQLLVRAESSSALGANVYESFSNSTM